MAKITELEDRLVTYLRKELNMSEEEFAEIIHSDDYEDLLDELANKECDVFLAHEGDEPLSEYQKCPGDLIDLICGPYEEQDTGSFLYERTDDKKIKDSTFSRVKKGKKNDDT